jgi:plastocyanin
MSYRRLLIALVAVVIALFGAIPVGTTGAATTAPGTGTAWQDWAGQGTADTAVTTMTFYPAVITIDVGDSITWTAVGEAHTVTFLSGGPQPSPLTPQAQTPAGGNTYDGTGYVNSGRILPGGTYTLTFTKAGTFPYVCLFHPGMVGTVIVHAAGTPYPITAAQYLEAATVQSQSDLITAANAMLNTPVPAPRQNSDGSTSYGDVTGVSVGQSHVMRFLPSVLTIHVGDSVTWTNQDMMAPHTVTFAPDGKYPEFPSQTAVTPTSNTTYDGTTFTNSGLIFASGAPTFPGIPATTSYTLKFTKAGVYVYHCLLHDENGMIGKIRVLPAGVAVTPLAPMVQIGASKIGPVLTDAQGHTLYYLTSEVGGQPSKCTGACLGIWPPLAVSSPSADAVEGAGLSGVLSVMTRSDGINQVMYGEQPLYTFAKDSAPGDVNGNGIKAFGGVWLAARATTLPLVSPLVTPQVSVGASGSFTVSWISSKAGQGSVYFGPGTSCSGLVEVATRDLGTGSTTHTVQVVGNDLPGSVGDNGIQPGVTYSFMLVTATGNRPAETDNNGGKCYQVTIPSS